MAWRSELFKEKVSRDIVEAGEGALPGDEGGHVLVALIDAVQDIEHHGAISETSPRSPRASTIDFIFLQ